MACEIPLTQNRVAIVDDEDYEELARFKWFAKKGWGGHTFYAGRNVQRSDGSRTTVYMHSVITGYSFTDHRNGNGLDNRRDNLRKSNRQKNNYNQKNRSARGTSRFIGVHWNRRDRKWYAIIRINHKRKHLGVFDDEDDAARAYDRAAYSRDSEFVHLNFPEEWPQ